VRTAFDPPHLASPPGGGEEYEGNAASGPASSKVSASATRNALDRGALIAWFTRCEPGAIGTAFGPPSPFFAAFAAMRGPSSG
jgi:hypothetical protein